MKNKLFKCVLFLLSVVLMFGVVGCKNKTDGSKDGYIKYDMSEYPHGVHKAVVKDSDKVILQDNNVSFKIITSEELTSYEKTALEELTYFLKLSTGCDVEIVLDNNKVYNENDYYISLGLNEWFYSSGLVINVNDLKSTGYRLLTKGNTMFVIGDVNGFGIVNGVYGLLEYLIDYKCYSTDEVKYNEKSKMTLKELDVTEVPAIETVVRTNIAYNNNKDLLRMHLTEFSSDFGLPSFGHNITVDWLTPEQLNAHKDWVSGEMPCFSNRDMADCVADNIFKKLMEDKRARLIFIGQSDGTDKCMCDTCEKERELYGPQESALLIRFVNYVSEKVDAMLVDAGDTRNIQYATYAYLNTEDPPVTKAEDGTYHANHPSVIPNKNVAIMFAPIYAQYNVSLLDEKNAFSKAALEQWEFIATIMWAYTYGVNYRDYFVGLNNFGAIQQNYQVFADAGVTFSYIQGKYGGKFHGSPNFNALREYLISELAWNPYADMDALIKEFMSAYYGPAADKLYEYYKLYRMHYAYLESEKGLNGSIYATQSAEYWGNMYLTEAENILNEAFSTIKDLETSDYSAYQKYYDRINIETITYRYLRLLYHRTLYSQSQIKTMIDSLESDCLKFGLDQYGELKYISDLIGSWRKEL